MPKAGEGSSDLPSDQEMAVTLHNYNHSSQKSIVQSPVGRRYIEALAGQMRDDERGFILFTLEPSEESREILEGKKPTDSETRGLYQLKLNVGVEMLVDPSFEDIRFLVSTSYVEAGLGEFIPEERKVLEQQAAQYEWDAIAESWLGCERENIMALCLGPMIQLGFTTFCFEKEA